MSKLFRLGIVDFGKGLLIAVGTGLLLSAGAAFTPGTFVSIKDSFNVSIAGGIAGGIAYLVKNWLTNSSGKLMAKEKK